MCKWVLCVAAASLAQISFGIWAANSSADSYPNKPIRIIDAFPAGGGSDYVARVLGSKLTARLGQPVILTSDLYGGGVKFHGRVTGLAGGTGSAFAVIPAQNATGNWIKVVQRLPVRIGLDPAELARHPLRVGLSMNVDIDTNR